MPFSKKFQYFVYVAREIVTVYENICFFKHTQYITFSIIFILKNAAKLLPEERDEIVC